jgi:KDO2-lipid IV(A) lauroyltransferase
MFFYILYRIGHALALILPRRVSCAVASLAADLYWSCSRRDRRSIVNNLRVVMGGEGADSDCDLMARDVFRNFAKYLVDFFRFSKLDGEFIKRYVKVEGEEFLKEALKRGKGAIILSAHLGDWELGGAVVALLGYRLTAVALTHQNRKINDFFIRQRSFGNVNVISIGPALKRCFSALRKNGCLALIGDRDFTDNGIMVDFFSKKARIPTGPAVLSMRTEAPIVPAFMIRQRDDTFRLIFREPISPQGDGYDAGHIKATVSKYLSVIEEYIKRYPAQWLMFREVWNGGNDSRPNTII